MATVPVFVTFVAGSVLTAAQMNSNVRDAGNFWLTAKPVALVTQTAAQAITNNAWNTVLFDSEVYDNDGMHSTVTNTGRLTAVTAGRYLFTAVGGCVFNATGLRAARLIYTTTGPSNIVLSGGSVNAVSTGNTETIFSLTGTQYLAVGDYVTYDLFQTSGGNLNTMIGMFSTAGSGPRFACYWLHNA